MIVFWISAALVSAAAAALIIHRATRAARMGVGADPSLAVYRRQLSEIDDLSDRGLLLEDERRSAHAEAARRLLAAADQSARPSARTSAPKSGGRGAVIAVAVVAAIAPLAAIGVYLFVGSPQSPDQPFARRVAEWRAADPGVLAPDQLVAVLQLVAHQRPNDPRVYDFLGRAQLAAGDAFSATQSLHKAIDLAPQRPAPWIVLGEAYLVQSGGDASPDALNAFRQAVRLDPAAPEARFYLARAKIAGGDVAGGLADWRALQHDLAADDPRRQALDQQIAIVDRTHALPVAPPTDASDAAAAGPGQPAFIKAMVDTLAARLKTNPDDPAGWARLIRSYAVLGDEPDRQAALARARVLFKARPDDLRLVEQASAGPQR